jgi:hypothetical protein
MRSPSRRYHPYLLLVAAMTLFSACASSSVSEPARFWGGVGFAYEAQDASVERERSMQSATVGMEKELGGGFGVGVEGSVKKH